MKINIWSKDRRVYWSE